ncbi:MAG: hypothetical protein ACRCUY_10140, partial [Thermoguttaceae bacterium]
YIDRAHYKILPTGGIIWTPKDDWVIKLLFPNPKIQKRFWKSGASEWWGYIHADYGGGSWTFVENERTDYNDIRFGGGIEFEMLQNMRLGGYFEVGGAFQRELYQSKDNNMKLPDAFFIKTGIVF